MNEEEIKKLKEIFPESEEIVKNGKKFHRFVVQKVNMPEGIGKRYLNIMYDENNVPFVVMNVLEGLTQEEKEKRKTEREKRRAEKKKETDKYKVEIKALKKQIRDNSKAMNFSVCEELKIKLAELENEYKSKFGRKK